MVAPAPAGQTSTRLDLLPFRIPQPAIRNCLATSTFPPPSGTVPVLPRVIKRYQAIPRKKIWAHWPAKTLKSLDKSTKNGQKKHQKICKFRAPIKPAQHSCIAAWYMPDARTLDRIHTLPPILHFRPALSPATFSLHPPCPNCYNSATTIPAGSGGFFI